MNVAGAPAALSLRDVSVSFHTAGGDVYALNEIELEVAPGEIQVVIGESGGGKSVLAETVMGLLPKNARVVGSIRVHGEEVLNVLPRRLQELRRGTIALAPQNPGAALNPVIRVGHLLMEVAKVKGIRKRERRERVRTVVEAMGLSFESVEGKYPFELSGGMQQRVTNALALLGEPRLVFADEPTSSLDRERIDDVAAQLKQLAAAGAAVVIITHDLDLARRLGGHTAVLYAGYLVEQQATSTLFTAPQHPYTRALLAAQPENGLHPISGNPPEMTRRFVACPFEPRCPLATIRCRTDIPGRSRVGNSEVRCFVTGT